MKKYLVYADTSVFGGCFDEDFSQESKKFFKMVLNGDFKLLISPLLIAEITEAPQNVKNLLFNLHPDMIEYIEFTNEIAELRDKYLSEKVLTNKSKSDAEHIAYATLSNADFVVSWNFKHIVHFKKISGFNSVNIKNSYKMINIYSPKEVI
jgi:predicted nucleic acid-binding protein